MKVPDGEIFIVGIFLGIILALLTCKIFLPTYKEGQIDALKELSGMACHHLWALQEVKGKQQCKACGLIRIIK